MKIQGQLTRLVLVSVLPAALAAGLLIGYAYERQREAIQQSTLETAQALGQAVDADLASARTALVALATSPHLTSGDLAAFHRQASEAIRELPGNNVVLSDASGQQLVNTLRPFGNPLPRHGNPAQLRRVFETGLPQISDVYIGAVARRPLIGIDVPVRRDGRVIYGMSMGFFPDRLSELLKQQKLPDGWVGNVYDSRGAVIARTHDAQRYVGQKGPSAVLERLAFSREGQVESETLEGTPAVFVFSRSALTNWSVAIAIPRALLARELRTSLFWIVAGTLVLLLTGLTLAHLLSARIAGAIRGLIAPATALGRGGKVELPALALDEAAAVGEALVNASRILRERAEVLAFVSHDLRNPLISLRLGTRSAEQMAAKLGASEPLRAQLATIAEICRGMSGTVDDLLAIAVSSSGGSSMHKMGAVDAASLITRASEAVLSQFAHEGIELRVESEGDLPNVWVDADRIQRVFVNLLDNALKFTPRPGHVVVRAEVREATVRYCVVNSGPALPAEELGGMFQPFWQAGAEAARGAGLGLSICRSIVETHGGRIWAEPQPGMRVRICFEVPRAPSPGTSTPAPVA